ncbi:MAG: HNH endonuclease [Planctomycetota bacterium]|nr:MAG: HNH endonuclease [Planctomycetota bacterium]REJ96013.1 MAG: HNH endonuclease [Planctomycetota bacterium]REK24169.1 MAG: HNH endonuclease [Planctomycetota bacterium]REK32435.1 MAG: HNH endonuclease [Planctomycetota bacterium]
MTSYVPADLRPLVESRANGLCEYCLIHADDTYLGGQVDHVIAEKHGGETDARNLSYACTFCNRSKGTDIGSLAAATGQFTRFFHPRSDRSADHFRLNAALIEPRTSIGEVTARILGFNEPDRLLERKALQKIGRYPPADAMRLIGHE